MQPIRPPVPLTFRPGLKPARRPSPSYPAKMPLRRWPAQSLLLAVLAVFLAGRLEAVDLNLLGTNLPPLAFHGFLSQGFLATTKYDYLAHNSRDGSFAFTEAGLNVAMDPFPRTHFAAQGFLFDVGDVGQYDPVLDYALVDYNFSDAFGIRAGRILRPEGIYNTSQSIDLARTSVFLPQGMYDSRWRDFDGSLDGGSIYGNFPLSQAGDLSYEIYAGLLDITDNGGVARQLQNELNNPPVSSFTGFKNNTPPVYGFQFWWDTPVAGLRAGTAGFMSGGLSYAYQVSPPYGPGAVTGFTDAGPNIQESLEYLWRNWTFQAEYQYVDYRISSTFPGGPETTFYTVCNTWYVSASYRVNAWLEAGSYYTEYYDNNPKSVTTAASDASQNDLALSLRFDPKLWWVVKVEAHYIRGTGLLEDNADNPVRNGDGWFMLALKTTFSF